jgi:crotonobetainyl-CoA:carnitine CoA-transferase CaiB-like acyl-CoA transferase
VRATSKRPPTAWKAASAARSPPASAVLAVRTVEGAMAQRQIAHRQAFAEVRDRAGIVRAVNPPCRSLPGCVDREPA